ncbi:MAG: hypothetical protein EA380_07505 [Phycisphaeraceae bacterium]|nr:MAG: hypothetical protein EA380_07505 [Phycisphaeraceae bacterium]
MGKIAGSKNLLRDFGRQVDHVDHQVVGWMHKWGHDLEGIGLAIVFFWFGMLKVMGEVSATSIIAKTVYFGDPETMVVVLGLWEAMIGVCFLFRPLNRIAIALLIVRLPGTALALVLKFDECFEGNILVPTIQGQYLIKDMTLVGAALVIGSTVRVRQRARMMRRSGLAQKRLESIGQIGDSQRDDA